jgi:hypothetical protein
LLHLLAPIKDRDYTHMKPDKFIKYVINNFNTYTEFSRSKVYQVARLRKLLPNIKSAFNS